MWVLGRTTGISADLQRKLLFIRFSYPLYDSPIYRRVVEASIEGQSTFGMEGTAEKKKEGTKVEKLQIVEAASALR